MYYNVKLIFIYSLNFGLPNYSKKLLKCIFISVYHVKDFSSFHFLI